MAHAPCDASIGRLARQFASAPGLPFAELLPDEHIFQALRDEGVSYRDRVFSPLVTLWLFVSQALDPDPSCRAAVARLLAWRATRGLPPASADPSAYARARHRLPEAVLARLAREAGRRTQDEAPDAWRWKGRTVKVVDGTTVSMPDTPANQEEYPQPRSQRPGLGFPIARVVVLFSLVVGTVLDAAMSRCRGKRTGETSLFHTLRHNMRAGDLLLADRYFSSYWEMASAWKGGWDMVSRLHCRRRADFRRGKRLGREDHVVCWPKPSRPEWMGEAEYEGLPGELAVRELRVRVERAGYRTRVLVVVTTLLDASEFPQGDVAVLYRVRWQAEVNLRTLKQTMQMDVLRCKSPEMVRKEVWAHVLGYNLLRGMMADAAKARGLLPWRLSFRGAAQAVSAFTAVLWSATEEGLEELYRRVFVMVLTHRVAGRPHRSEPRARKRRPKPFPLLTEPRQQSRARSAASTCGQSS